MILRSSSGLSSILCALSATTMLACSASEGSGAMATSGTGGAGGAGTSDTTGANGATTTGGAGGDMGIEFPGGGGGGSPTGGGGTTCSVASQFVYTVDSANGLYKFDPPTRTFTLIGTLKCPSKGTATPFSMAVDRNANALVLFNDGTLFKVNTETAACAATSFVPGQSGFTTFGMGFASNTPGSADETLYVSNAKAATSTNDLATINTQTMKLTPIGSFDKLNAGSELTGTGDARLFGAFQGSPYSVAEIDKSNAKILSVTPQTGIQYPGGSFNFAFAFWGGDFWIFAGPGTSTDVWQYSPSTKMTTKVKHEAFPIVGAGVSTCAPTKPPA